MSLNKPSNAVHLFLLVISSLALGGPGPLCPAPDLHEQVRQLVWRHATCPLPNETGPRFVQGPGLHPPQEIQGDRAALTRLAPLVGHSTGGRQRLSRAEEDHSGRAHGSLFPSAHKQRTKTAGCDGLCGPSDTRDTLLTLRKI